VYSPLQTDADDRLPGKPGESRTECPDAGIVTRVDAKLATYFGHICVLINLKQLKVEIILHSRDILPEIQL
jgi:hypothetical protein